MLVFFFFSGCTLSLPKVSWLYFFLFLYDLVTIYNFKRITDSDEDSELEDELENVTKKSKNKQDEYKLPEDRKLEEARQARLAVRLISYFILFVYFPFFFFCFFRGKLPPDQ